MDGGECDGTTQELSKNCHQKGETAWDLQNGYCPQGGSWGPLQRGVGTTQPNFQSQCCPQTTPGVCLQTRKDLLAPITAVPWCLGAPCINGRGHNGFKVRAEMLEAEEPIVARLCQLSSLCDDPSSYRAARSSFLRDDGGNG